MGEDFEVLAVRVPPGENRVAVRDALIARLATEGLLSARYVGPPPRGEAAPPTDLQLVTVIVESVRRLRLPALGDSTASPEDA